MSFILRIFFSGLIAFVPSKDGKELNVLLLDATHAQHVSAGILPVHKALLLVRGNECERCRDLDPSIAEFLYPEVASANAASASLAKAVTKGGNIWELDGSQIAFNMPKDGVNLVHSVDVRHQSVPGTATELADFGWVPNLREIDPSIGGIDASVFSNHPRPGLLVARLKLTSGTVSTYSVVQINRHVVPIEFRPAGSHAPPAMTRAAANWVEAEIRIQGDSVTIAEENFDGNARRTITLTPLNGIVEMAVLNIARPIKGTPQSLPRPGVHFARYWDLAQHPPAAGNRAIPQVPQNLNVRNEALRPDAPERAQDLLDYLFVSAGRGPYDQLLCPMSQYPSP